MNNEAHPLRLRVQRWMAQNTSNGIRYQVAAHIEEYKTVAFMPQASLEKIHVKCEKRRSVKLVEQRNYLVVSHPFAADAFADFPDVNPPFRKQGAFFVGNVLVHNVHADRFSSPYSVA
jgi:hypothetical protein